MSLGQTLTKYLFSMTLDSFLAHFSITLIFIRLVNDLGHDKGLEGV